MKYTTVISPIIAAVFCLSFTAGAQAVPPQHESESQIGKVLELRHENITTDNPNVARKGNNTVSFGNFSVTMQDNIDDIDRTSPYASIMKGKDGDYLFRETTDGGQFVSLSNNPSENTFKYKFEGKYLEKLDNGSVIVRTSEFGEPLAVIEAPWAVDAKNQPITTYFETSTDTLVQIVDFRGNTTFPVIADPRIRLVWHGASIDFTRHETNLMAAGAGGCAAVSVAIPDPSISKAVALSCGLIATWAGYASAEGKCVSVKIVPGIASVPWISKCYA